MRKAIISLAAALVLLAPIPATSAPAGGAAACTTIPCELADLGAAPCDFDCVRARARDSAARGFWLGAAYANGTGTSKDLDAAADAWRSAAAAGDAMSAEAYGELSERRMRYDVAAEYYKAASAAKYAPAAYYLGLLYAAHLAVPEAKSVPSPVASGDELQNGRDGDYKIASFQQVLASADEHFGPAYVRIALYYAQAYGTSKDCSLAKHWYVRARTEKHLGFSTADESTIKNACPGVKLGYAV